MYSKTYLIINRNMLLTCHVMIYYIFVKLLFVSPSTLTHFSFANKPTTGNLIKDKYTCKIGIQIYLNTKTECSESGTGLIHHLGSWWSFDREVEGTPLLHLFCHKAFLHCFNATWLHCIATLLIRIIVCSNNEALNHAACTHNG